MEGGYPVLPITANRLDVTFIPAGASFADGAGFQVTGKEILLVWNKNVGAQTVTITSVADPVTKRTGDIAAYSIGINEIMYFGPVFPTGWVQADGNIYLAAGVTDVNFAVLRLP